MTGRKKSAEGDVVVLLSLVVGLVFLLIPTITTFLLWRKFKKIPDSFSSRKNCLKWLVLASLSQYAGNIISVVFLLIDKTFTYSILLPTGIGILVSIPFLGLFYKISSRLKLESEGILLYEDTLRDVLTDRRIDDGDIVHLRDIILRYNLPDDILEAKNNLVFMDMLYETAEDLVVDSEEIKILNELSGKIGIDSSNIDYANAFTEKINTVKKIMDGELAEIEPPPDYIPRRDEKCLFCSDCSLFENVTKGAFVGVSVSIKDFVPIVGKLLKPRIYSGKKVSYTQMKRIDEGLLVITDKRVAFIGRGINREFLLDKILGIDAGNDGIQINRAGKKKKEVFKLGGINSEIAVVLLIALLKER